MDVRDEEMRQFTELSPVMQAWALVGFYLGHFAILEHAIENSVMAMIGGGPLASVVINTNIGMAEKLRILRTATDLAYGKGPEKVACQKALISVQETHLPDRNIIAHCVFLAKDGGVEFITAKAASRLLIERNHWPVAKFFERVDQMNELHAVLEGLRQRMDNIAFQAMMRAKDNDDMHSILDETSPGWRDPT